MSDNHQTPDQVSVQIQNLAELMRAQFNAVQTQLVERDAQIVLAKQDAQKAIETALVAQKEVERIQNASNMVAMQRTEKSTLQQLNAIKDVYPKNGVLVEADLAAVRDKVDGMNGQDHTIAIAAFVVASLAFVSAGLRWLV